MLSFCQ